MSRTHLLPDAHLKVWADLRARAAFSGITLWRSDASDGPVRFFVGRSGLVRVLQDARDVDHYLGSIGVPSAGELRAREALEASK